MGGGDIEKREEENGPHRGVGMEEAVYGSGEKEEEKGEGKN